MDRMFDPLDASFLLHVMEERGQAVANEADQQFLDTLAEDLDEGRVAVIPPDDRTRLFRLAKEVGVSWVDLWFPAEHEALCAYCGNPPSAHVWYAWDDTPDGCPEQYPCRTGTLTRYAPIQAPEERTE